MSDNLNKLAASKTDSFHIGGDLQINSLSFVPNSQPCTSTTKEE